MEIAGYLAAVLIGLSLGLVGGGGSVLTIPILVYFFHVEPVLATTYSLIIVGVSSFAGTFSHYKKKNVDFKTALIFGPPLLVTVFTMRKWVMPAIPQHILQAGNFELTKPVLLMLVFAAIMLAASISMLKKDKTVIKTININYTKLVLQSIIIGMVTGFVGVGGGFLIIPSLVFFAGLPMKKAVGTSLLVITISSLLGVLGDISQPIIINYPFLISFTALAISGVFAGGYLSSYIPDARLKPAFGWFVMAMGLFVFISTIYK